MAGDGGGADVEPVRRLWGEFFEMAGLYGVNPAGNSELSLTLEKCCVGCNEFVGIHIADGNTRHDGRSVEDVRFTQMVSTRNFRPNEPGLVGTQNLELLTF